MRTLICVVCGLNLEQVQHRFVMVDPNDYLTKMPVKAEINFYSCKTHAHDEIKESIKKQYGIKNKK